MNGNYGTVLIKKKGVLHNTRNRVISSVLAATMILMLGIMIFNYQATYQNAKNDILELSKNSTEKDANNIEQFLMRHREVLLTLAEALELYLAQGDYDGKKIEELLRNISISYNDSVYKSITGVEFKGIYASVDGVLYHGLQSRSVLPEQYDPTQRQWYNEGLAGNGNAVFGEPYVDVYNPDVLVITVTNLLSDGTTVIGMDITMDDLNVAAGDIGISIAVNGEIKNYGFGFLMTNNGIAMTSEGSSLYGSDPDCSEYDYSDPSHPMYPVYKQITECDRNESGENAHCQSIELDGVDYCIFSKRLDNGWYFATLINMKDIRTSISNLSAILVTGTIVVSVIALFFCLTISMAYIKTEKVTENLQDALNTATTDSLTGYSNRTAFDMKVSELSSILNTPNDISFVILMIDLNDLKYINDHKNHAEGDQYIRNTCELVRSIIPSEIYRIGGDEFAVFLTDDLFINRKRLYNRLKQAIANANLALVPEVDSPSFAIGLAVHTAGNNDTMDSLIRKADAEMYTNKAAIKHTRLEFSEIGYTPDLKFKVLDKQLLASELKTGLDEEQFEVWFQPQVNHVNNGTLIGAEALVRWRHPTRGMVSPTVFIPLFEYNGLVYELDKYVWRHTCQCMRRLENEGLVPFPISVNVSRQDITQPDFLESIISITDEYQIPHEYLHLEITESAFSDDTDKIVEIVNTLIDNGFIIAIDDFGSGYSSLSLLRNVPSHIVKLDMRFFIDEKNQTRNECIVESVVRMVKMLGMAVLAEGVERPEQAEQLRNLGCAYIQGYLYSRPLPYDEFVKYAQAAVSEKINHTGKAALHSETDASSAESQELFHSIVAGTNDVIIVADLDTKQLLYANHKAEQFYQKRFDPMHPTTCTEYCENHELCKNCPVRGMKHGETKEFVSSVSGVPLRVRYRQIDWNGHNAFVYSQADMSAELSKIEYANALINNLGVGIVIFRGRTPDELKPIFCNNEFMTLSGMTQEEFSSLLTKEHDYCVYSEDIAEIRNEFRDAIKNNRPVRRYMRVKGPHSDIEWVYMYLQIKHQETGDFMAYMVFLNAEDEMRKRAIDTERYQNYIEKATLYGEKSLTVVHFNLMKNTCRRIYRSIHVKHEAVFDYGLDEFLSSVVSNIVNEKTQNEFIERFSSASLKADFERGMFKDEMKLPLRLADEDIIWCYQTVNISQNPETGDLEAVMSLTEADKDIRKAEYYQRIVKLDYELVGNIDAKTGIVTIIGETDKRELPSIRKGAVPYMESLSLRVNTMVDERYTEQCYNAMSLDTVLEKLKKQKRYIITYPANVSRFGDEHAFQWSYCYADDSNTEILFYRKTLDKFIPDCIDC